MDTTTPTIQTIEQSTSIQSKKNYRLRLSTFEVGFWIWHPASVSILAFGLTGALALVLGVFAGDPALGLRGFGCDGEVNTPWIPVAWAKSFRTLRSGTFRRGLRFGVETSATSFLSGSAGTTKPEPKFRFLPVDGVTSTEGCVRLVEGKA